MQDEIFNKEASFTIQTAKLTGRLLAQAMKKALSAVNPFSKGSPGGKGSRLQKQQLKVDKANLKLRKQERKEHKVYQGKQSMKKLDRHGDKLEDIEITKDNIGSFKPFARKYHLQYCLKLDKSTTPPTYHVFFKSKRQKSQMAQAFKEYSRAVLQKQQRPKPSIRAKLEQFKEQVKNQVQEASKSLKRGLER